jgi:hypothetical protein
VLETCDWKIDGTGHAAAKLEPLGPSVRGAAGPPALVRLDAVERAHTLRSRMRKLGITRPAPPAEPRGPVERMSARSITFSSSRTLPGHA